uniref:Large ribosomal subunit protein eL28 n=1 Tax=Cacopsylla melanoneura TaxID=428564 RepID=A0A8D8SPF3_9HEMI
MTSGRSFYRLVFCCSFFLNFYHTFRKSFLRNITSITMVSSHLVWNIVKNNNAYLMKADNIKKWFSKEPGNLPNLASFKYSGLVHAKTIHIQPTADNKGFACVTKRANKKYKPGKAVIKQEWKSGPRRSLLKLRKYIVGNKYRKELTKAALRRASAILQSQKRAQIPAKKSSKKKADN